MHLTVIGAPRTKKAHNRTADLGARCFKCHRGSRTIVLPSEAFEEFQTAAAPQLRRAWLELAQQRAAGARLVQVTCSFCKGTGARKCIGCAGTGSRPPAAAEPCNVAATFYRDALRGDLVGYMQAIADIMEVAGVLENDRQIVSWDGSRLDKDAARPRVELEVTFLEVGGQADLFTTTATTTSATTR